MGELLYSSNIGFNMSDWENESLTKVFAGANCIMALTADGRVLQKTDSVDISARTKYWRNIKTIAISGWLPGAALGLLEDGTCMISKRPLRRYCEGNGFSVYFNKINDTVKSWHDIKEIAVSDAFFALGQDGRVRYVPFHPHDDYYSTVSCWSDIDHIVTGLQSSIIGITKDGKVLASGGNMNSRRNDNMTNVKSACCMGSECEVVYYLLKDGTVVSNYGTLLDIKPTVAIIGHFDYSGIAHHADMTLTMLGGRWSSTELLDGKKIVSYAIGDHNYRSPFWIALSE